MRRILAAILGLAVATSANAQTISPSFFGQHIEFVDTVSPWPKFYSSAYRMWFSECGNKTAHWSDIETASGTFTYTALDCIVNTYTSHGVGNNLIYTFGIVPGWANGGMTGDVPPTNFSDFYTFVSTLVAREKGKIRYYEIWNEMNLSGAPDAGWWSGTSAQMVTIAQNIYPLIKAADPNAVVLCPSTEGTTGFAYMQAWLAADIAAGGPHCDVFNYHGYAANAFPLQQPEQTLNIAQNYAGIALQNGMSALPVFVDEGGYQPSLSAALAPAYTAVYEIMFACAGVNHVDWFQYDNGNGFGELNPGTVAFGLNASGVAYREAEKWLIGSTIGTTCTRAANANQVRNTAVTGASAGTPGTPPTNWGVNNPDTGHGISTSIIGTGTEAGVPYVDWRVFGTATAGASGAVQMFTETSTHIAATLGQQWSVGADVKLQAGSATGATVSLNMNENNAAGTFLAGDTQWVFQPLANALNLDGQSYPGKTANASVAFIQPYVQVAYTVGAPVDITLRLGAPDADSGTVWTATITKPSSYQAQIVWDAAGGPTTYTVPTGQGYASYRDLTGAGSSLGSTVTITNLPIILENTAWKGWFVP